MHKKKKKQQTAFKLGSQNIFMLRSWENFSKDQLWVDIMTKTETNTNTDMFCNMQVAWLINTYTDVIVLAGIIINSITEWLVYFLCMYLIA